MYSQAEHLETKGLSSQSLWVLSENKLDKSLKCIIFSRAVYVSLYNN